MKEKKQKQTEVHDCTEWSNKWYPRFNFAVTFVTVRRF